MPSPCIPPHAPARPCTPLHTPARPQPGSARNLYAEFTEQGGVLLDEDEDDAASRPSSASTHISYLSNGGPNGMLSPGGAHDDQCQESSTLGWACTETRFPLCTECDKACDKALSFVPSGAKQRMKRWVRHEGIREKSGWAREPLDRNEQIRTPAPKTRSKKGKNGAPQAGRLVFDDCTSRPQTAASVFSSVSQRRPRQDYL